MVIAALILLVTEVCCQVYTVVISFMLISQSTNYTAAQE